MKQITTDFVIVGAGIVGITIALELHKQHPQARIDVFEKEAQIGLHASGRNSGVLHSGIYYKEGSLKAKVCAMGAKRMRDYCLENNLPINRTGKVILPLQPSDDHLIDLLYQRALANQAKVEIVDEKQLKELEPDVAIVTGRALYSPDTAVIDSKIVLEHLYQQIKSKGVHVHFNARIEKIDSDNNTLTFHDQQYRFQHLFNTAGLYADQVAKAFDIAKHYTMLPFKGIYYKLNPASNIKVNHLIYPVPDLNVPFLGVHFTKTIHGDVILGPTAVPAWGRENYSKLKGVKLEETMAIVKNLLQQYVINNQGFRQFAHNEAGRYFKSRFAKAAAALTPKITNNDLLKCDKVGIRAQLLDTKKRELIMDFLVESTGHSTHILNAVSPAFTCSLAFAEMIVKQVNLLITT